MERSSLELNTFLPSTFHLPPSTIFFKGEPSRLCAPVPKACGRAILKHGEQLNKVRASSSSQLVGVVTN